MAIKKPAMVLIDVDGTLVDSVPDLAYCVDEMMKQLDMPVYGEDKVRNWVGNGVERLTRRALIGQLDGEPDDALFEKAYPIFLDLYDKNVCERSCLYDGVREALDFLKTQDVKIGCVTNKNAQFTLPFWKSWALKMILKLSSVATRWPRRSLIHCHCCMVLKSWVPRLSNL